MRLARSAVLVVGGLVLAACSNPDRFAAVGDGSGIAPAPGTAAAPSPTPGGPSDPTSVAYFNQTIGDRVLFAVDQSNLSDGARQTLTGQADWLLANADYTAIVEGHADEQGTREYNLALGARRAASVRDFLVSRGVAANRIETLTYGKERPLEVCSTEECYAKNRRAVTVVAGGLPVS